MSSEMWECLNTTWFEIPARKVQVQRIGAHSFLRWVRDRAALFAGLTDSTMSRSDAWHFVVLGRSIERVDMTARLMSVRVAAGGSRPGLAHPAPSGRRRGGVPQRLRRRRQPEQIAEFLLRDRLFPRSAFHALAEAERCLGELALGARAAA